MAAESVARSGDADAGLDRGCEIIVMRAFLIFSLFFSVLRHTSFFFPSKKEVFFQF